TILSTEPGVEVVGEASNGREALDQVETLDPDVVCMDVQMPHMDGIEATKELTASGARAAVLILTTFDRDDFLFETLNAGGRGFVASVCGVSGVLVIYLRQGGGGVVWTGGGGGVAVRSGLPATSGGELVAAPNGDGACLGSHDHRVYQGSPVVLLTDPLLAI